MLNRLLLLLFFINSCCKTTSFTLDFAIEKWSFASQSGILYAGASQEVDSNTYALSALGRTTNEVIPLAPQTITLNNMQDQINPVFGKAIQAMTTWGERPLVVTTDKQDRLIFYNGIGFGKAAPTLSMISCDSISDALGNPAYITLLAGDSQSLSMQPYNAFIGILPQSGLAQDAGTGLALVSLTTSNNKSSLSVAPTIPFNGETIGVSIGSAGSVKALNDMYWDPILETLFIAYSAQAGSSLNDGIRSIALAKRQNSGLEILAIAPDTAFSNTSTLIGTLNAEATSSVQKVRTMHTSTRLAYLIFIQNNSAYAAPLINTPKSQTTGTLASINALPINTFMDQFPYLFIARTINQQALTPSDMIEQSTLSAHIGGTFSLEATSTITDLFVSTDAVFITVQDETVPANNGLYQSQALFGANGVITAWTNWERAGGNFGIPSSFLYDPYAVLFWNIQQQAESTVFDRSQWSPSKLGEPFPMNKGGVQIAEPFIINGNCLLVLGGNNLITINQTGTIINGPNNPVSYPYQFSTMGAITSCSVATDGFTYWFVIGGSSGVTVLANADGSGWNGSLNTLTLLKNYSLGNFTNVRRIQTDGSTAYILTDTDLKKIVISPAIILAGGSSAITTVAQANTFLDNPKTFSDLLVINPVMILGTTRGLYYAPINTTNWSLIQLNESPGPVSALYACSSDTWTNIYALATTQSQQQSAVYRLSLTPSGNIIPFQDYFVKNIPTYFMKVDDFRNYVTNNGALFELSRSKYLQKSVVLEKLPPNFQCGDILLSSKATPLNAALIPTAETIRRLIHDPASGSLIAYGNFGVNNNSY